jgi:hypothetical protein
MKPDHKTKPLTLMLRAKNPADLRRIADVEAALSRQVGWKVVLEPFVDAAGDEYRMVGWPAKRQDQAAVAMFLRRGAKPNDPALLTTADVHEKKTVDVLTSKGLTKKAKP